MCIFCTVITSNRQWNDSLPQYNSDASTDPKVISIVKSCKLQISAVQSKFCFVHILNFEGGWNFLEAASFFWSSEGSLYSKPYGVRSDAEFVFFKVARYTINLMFINNEFFIRISAATLRYAE